MLASIHPLGERARNRSWGLTVSAHVLGALGGGLAIGAALGLAGTGLRALVRPGPVMTAVVLVAAATTAVALDLGVAGLRLPTVRRQVNELWLNRYRGTVYGVAYGVQLGAGVVTIVTTGLVYLALFLSLWSGSVAAGAAIGGTFGLVRGASVLTVAHVDSAAELRKVHRRLAELHPTVRRLAIGVELAVAGAGTAGLVLR